MTDTYNSTFSYEWFGTIIDHQSCSEYKYHEIRYLWNISAKCQMEHLDCYLVSLLWLCWRIILNLNILSVKSGHANIGTQFLIIFCECLSLHCKGHNSVSLVWMFALCVVPANRRRWRPSCRVTSVLYPGRVRPMRLLPKWRLWAA